MGSIQFTFTIKGLGNVFSNAEDKLRVDDVIFYLDGKHKYSQIVVEAKDLSEGEVKARDLVSRSLSKIIFAYITEASMDNNCYNFIDYTHEPPQTGGVNGLLTIFSIGLQDPKITLEKISHVKSEKKSVLDLSLAYYRLSFYDNPIMLLTMFSTMSVIVRDIMDMKVDDFLEIHKLKDKLYEILQKEANGNQSKKNSIMSGRNAIQMSKIYEHSILESR